MLLAALFQWHILPLGSIQPFCVSLCGYLSPSFIEDMHKRQVGSVHASESARRKHFMRSGVRGRIFCEMMK